MRRQKYPSYQVYNLNYGLFHVIFTRRIPRPHCTPTTLPTPARARVSPHSAAPGAYYPAPRASPARRLRHPPQTRNAGTALGIFGSPPRGRPHAHSDGCPHDPGRVPKDLNESARISARRDIEGLLSVGYAVAWYSKNPGNSPSS